MDLIPRLQDPYKLDMTVTNRSHYTSNMTVANGGSGGGAIAALSGKIGADGALHAGSRGAGGVSFADEMLKAVDKVSGNQNFAAKLTELAITNPDSVDVHDITIAQAEAEMSLNIARTIINRLTQAWKDVINAR
jgi:flagellar hook-basal body complex protein FliE